MLDQPTFIGRVIKNEGINFTVTAASASPIPDIWLTDALTPKGGAIYISQYDLEKELEARPAASWTRRSGSSSTSRSSGRS